MLVTIAVALLFLRQARAMHVFDLARYESRFERAGRFVAARLPANALVITDYESASVRFYSGRPTLVWGALDPAWLKDAVTFARRHGFEPYLLFERSEEEPFRRRFASSSPIGALDWPPMAEVATQVFVYRVVDRELYEAGVSISTEYTK